MKTLFWGTSFWASPAADRFRMAASCTLWAPFEACSWPPWRIGLLCVITPLQSSEYLRGGVYCDTAQHSALWGIGACYAWFGKGLLYGRWRYVRIGACLITAMIHMSYALNAGASCSTFLTTHPASATGAGTHRVLTPVPHASALRSKYNAYHEKCLSCTLPHSKLRW